MATLLTFAAHVSIDDKTLIYEINNKTITKMQMLPSGKQVDDNDGGRGGEEKEILNTY